MCISPILSLRKGFDLSRIMQADLVFVLMSRTIEDDGAPGAGGHWSFSSLSRAKTFHISDTPVSTRRAAPIVVQERI